MTVNSTDDSFVFPLKIGPNRRFLVDQNDRPFLVHGDTAWSLISALDESEVERYLADRAAKGFNAIIVNLIEHKFNGPLNRRGEHPFHNPQDLGSPNDSYFEFADWVIGKAAGLGFVVFLAPLYLGYKHKTDDDGWYHEARSGGMNRCYRYGYYLGRRYAAFKNLIWMIGGDRNPDGVIDEVNSMILGIKEFDQHSLFTAHAHPEEPTPARYGWGGWLDLNGTYTYQIIHKKLRLDYNHKPVMPFVLMESSYEGEHNASPVQIRRQAYWANLSGATGQFFGNNPIWLFNPGWEEALDSQGSRDMRHVKRLFTSRPWYGLVPDQARRVVTGGLGEFNGLDYLTAALTGDGRTLMAYMPTARTITVDLSTVSGEQVVGWWFNPRTGLSQPAGEFPGRGQIQLEPPEAGDWALIMDDAAQNLPAPGGSS